MSTLYLITGPAGVGKSTISNKIANLKEKSVLIEGDDIYHQVVGSYMPAWKDGNHLELFWEINKLIINKYLESGYDVIFNYIIEKDNLEFFKENFKEYEIKFIVLLVNEETLLKRDALRPEDCQMHKRCLVLLNSFLEENFDSDYILYTDNLTVDETVKQIESNERFIVSR